MHQRRVYDIDSKRNLANITLHDPNRLVKQKHATIHKKFSARELFDIGHRNINLAAHFKTIPLGVIFGQ